jgi:hypothetical protein
MSKTDKNQNKNKEPIYCINREISEEEAILSLAEGWSTSEPPTQEMLDNSYYKKAFERLKEGKLTWNWAAALGGFFWLGLHSVIGIYIYTVFLLRILPIGILPQYIFIIHFTLSSLLGFCGNKLLFLLSKRRYKNGYAFLKKYKRGVLRDVSFFATCIVIFFTMTIFALVLNSNQQYLLNPSSYKTTFLAVFASFFLIFDIVNITRIKILIKKFVKFNGGNPVQK